MIYTIRFIELFHIANPQKPNRGNITMQTHLINKNWHMQKGNLIHLLAGPKAKGMAYSDCYRFRLTTAAVASVCDRSSAATVMDIRTLLIDERSPGTVVLLKVMAVTFSHIT